MVRIRLSDDNKVFNYHFEGIPYISFDTLDRLGVPNAYSTRYESYDPESGTGKTGLRFAVMKDETPEEASPVVRANRDRLARQLGSSLSRECITDQKHTNYVHVATVSDLGLSDKPLHMQSVDGVVTDIPDVLLTVFGGDCPPVYIADPVRKAVGLVHAGWRGTLGRIPRVAIANMVVKFGCDPKDMYAAVGPGICRDCYEMGDEVYDSFAADWGHEAADRILSRYPAFDKEGREIPGGKYHLDLREANRMTLLEAGIPEENISVSNICTKCNVDTFYSYRAGRMENEQAAMIVNRFDI
ncbi:MAG: peptidoglycan editing factor PgeF [Clostridiales bacterium]|nr:peptidoglycan editing factor PgeF [Clostridiales bacterium]